MKQQIIPAQKEMNVPNIITVILIVFVISCGTTKENVVQTQENIYDIIEKVNYGEEGLFYRTLSYDQLPFTQMFSYNKVNEENVKLNSITEERRFVNFDTIFNEEQRKEIDYHLKNLETTKLKPSQFSNPKVLSKVRTPYGTPLEDQKGRNSITFPFIVNSAKKVPYGFIYRNSTGLLHIYKKQGNNWEEFARVEIHLL